MGSLNYREAGVDIEEGERVANTIHSLAKKTYRPEVLKGIGGFGALFSISPIKYRNPVLVSSTDGVGTKLKIAFAMDRHSTVGIDLVAMGVNDIVTHGAEPLFFLDYIATGKLSAIRVEEIVEGIVEGCTMAGCSLVGGETAEMPGFYREGEYDIAGFTVGIVERDRVIDGSDIRIGDRIVGLASSGLHSNGFSLARKVLLEMAGFSLMDEVEGLSGRLGDELLTPTRIYTRTVLNLIRDFTVKGIAHITGGGIPGNVSRILPEGCKAVIERGSWKVPPIFKIIERMGGIEEEEMLRTFNYGIGMVVVLPAQEVEDALYRLRGMGEEAFLIGRIAERVEGEGAVVFL